MDHGIYESKQYSEEVNISTLNWHNLEPTASSLLGVFSPHQPNKSPIAKFA